VGSPTIGSFFIGEGDLAEEPLSETLSSLSYYETEYRGIKYLRNSLEDFQHDLSLPVGMRFGQMNRVQLDDNQLTISNATAGLTAILDARLDNPPTLLDSVSHSGLARQMGGNTVGIAFLPPGLFLELQQGTRRETIPNDDYGPFFYEKYQDWGQLHQFNLAAVGYRTDGPTEQLMVALYYPDPEAPEADLAEIERRWQEYYLTLLGRSGPLAKLCTSFVT
jgi:hypothetical protein